MKKTIDLYNLKLLVLDVDGVLTDGGIIIHSDGTESKRFHVFDGHRIKMWERAGYASAIISGRETVTTSIRAEQLGIDHVFQNCKQKLPVFETLLSDLNLTVEQTIYIGDDLMDIPLMRRAGFGVAVANATEEVRQFADYVTNRPGGQGAVGEVVEHVLRKTGRWKELIERYLV